MGRVAARGARWDSFRWRAVVYPRARWMLAVEALSVPAGPAEVRVGLAVPAARVAPAAH